ncbi:MAG: helix-turn-helix transcriptional regulator [Spirochaetia bacterium]|nr:helix-turn-helix transcriptional regulator [Spirochaetia bacterium]
MACAHASHCMGKTHTTERFMEVCLLQLLTRASTHGYDLAEQLADFGFDPGELNISTLYRTMRKMEEDMSVTSRWEKSEHGPRRRVYEITERGREELALWIEMLKQRKTRIEQLIDAYELQTGKHADHS